MGIGENELEELNWGGKRPTCAWHGKWTTNDDDDDAADAFKRWGCRSEVTWRFAQPHQLVGSIVCQFLQDELKEILVLNVRHHIVSISIVSLYCGYQIT